VLIAEVGNIFYFLGVGLTLMALIVAFTGMRFKNFPSSRAQMVGGLVLMVALVASTATFAVILSAHEKETRNAEKAAAIADNEVSTSQDTTDAEGTVAASVADSDATSDTTAPSGGGETLPLSSPESGDIIYDTTTLSAKAGTVTIDYTNPSPVPHSVAIDSSDGTTEAEGEIVQGGSDSIATADLKAGKYTYYCTVPGHRESGMEGTLTVK
jgi:plastocyanin